MIPPLPYSELLTLSKLWSVCQRHLACDRHQRKLLVLLVEKPWNLHLLPKFFTGIYHLDSLLDLRNQLCFLPTIHSFFFWEQYPSFTRKIIFVLFLVVWYTWRRSGQLEGNDSISWTTSLVQGCVCDKARPTKLISGLLWFPLGSRSSVFHWNFMTWLETDLEWLMAFPVPAWRDHSWNWN